MSAHPPGSSSPDAGKTETNTNKTASATVIGHPFPEGGSPADERRPEAENPQQAVALHNASGRPNRRRRKPEKEEAPNSGPKRTRNQRRRANKKTAASAKKPVVIGKELQPLTPAEAMTASVADDDEPIRSVRISSIPTRLTANKLKTILLDMFGGTIVGVEIAGKNKRKTLGKFAVVTYAEAETAANVLNDKTCSWQSGRRLRIIPSARSASTTAAIYSTVSRLRSLNDDCLLHIYRHLELCDVLNCDATSPQLAAFADANNVYRHHAHNCTLFRVGQYSAYEAAHGGRVQPIARPRIAEALRCLGPFLTSLTINGALVARGHECLRLVLLHSSAQQLHTLRLHNLNMKPFRGEPPLPHGNQFGAIHELALIHCEHVQQPLLTFIAQLPQLERLTLHNSLSTMPSASLRMPCKQLRYMSVRNGLNHSQLLGDAIDGSAQTLRELNVLIPNAAAYQTAWLEGMQPFLSKRLESLLVMQPVADNRTGEMRLDELVDALGGGALRKLVMCDWSTERVLFDWLDRMGDVQLLLHTLCLSQCSQAMSIRVRDALVDAFGEQLRVLEVRHAGYSTMYELQVMCGRLHELRELHLFECFDSAVLGVVLAAIAANPHLCHVELHIAIIDDMVPFVKRVVKGLRRRRRRHAAAAAALTGKDATELPPPVLLLRLTGEELIQVPTAELLRDSEDVLRWQFVADERGFDQRDDDRSDRDDLLHNELHEEYDSDFWLDRWSDDDFFDAYDYRDTDSDNDLNELGDVNDIDLFVGNALMDENFRDL